MSTEIVKSQSRDVVAINAADPVILVKYSSNNSGGRWWLNDEDWENLEKAGWQVDWIADGGRWLGARAQYARKAFNSVSEAILEFEAVTKCYASDEGCNCCGPPHSFSWERICGKTPEGEYVTLEEYNYISGSEVLEYLHDNAPADLRTACERISELEDEVKRLRK